MRTDNIAIFHDTLDIAKRGRYICEDREIPLQLAAEQMLEVQAFPPGRIQ
ncbi:MAG: hypothetical protein LUE24_04240 [Lachnospiraceae bacterium]|nr:hypothetical protein [Lachnospiraceae bacterium]